MSKLLVIVILLSCFSTFSYSQPKIQFGVNTEGSWFMPHQMSRYSEQNKSGFAVGIGAYASKSIYGKLSGDIGLMYRYKEMQQHYTIPSTGTGEYGYPSTPREEGWKKYALHYVVLPMHLQLLYSKYAFIRGGIEASWLTNYNPGNKKTEYNWMVGVGSQKYKLKWSLNYIRGFKEVGFANGLYEIENGKYRSGTFYRNNMLQLNLSYPIWQIK